MKNAWLFLAVIVIGSILLLQIGCQQQSEVSEATEAAFAPSRARPKHSSAEAQIVPEANEPAPRIKFEKTVCDLGKLAPGAKHSCEFRFTNIGDALLKITKKVQTCCGFSGKLKDNKTKYAPGESGTVIITFSAKRLRGNLIKYQYVRSNDRARPRVKLTVKARITPKVDYKPETLKLSLRDENAACPEITLSSLDGRPFSITRFKSTGGSITADYDPGKQATRFVLQPKVDIEKLRKGLNGRIDISLTHPECKTVTIPFNTQPEFTTDPPLINIREAESQKPIIREVWILSNYGEDFEIESTSSKNNIVKVLSQEKVGNRYKFELEITPPAAEDKVRIFSDVFFVNIKGGRKVKITCFGVYSGKQKESRQVDKSEPGK